MAPHTSEEWQQPTSWDSLAPGRGFSGSEGVHLVPGLCGCPRLRWNPGSGPPHCHQAPLKALEILVASEASLAASQGSFPCFLDQEPVPRASGEDREQWPCSQRTYNPSEVARWPPLSSLDLRG